MATWRGRLDQTTNWAVVVVGAILTWAFSSADNPHYVILIGVFGVTAFLAMEATRYREYDIWRNRVRVLQRGLYAQMYAPDPSDDAGWQAKLGNELRDPEFEMSYREALTHRLRRSYVALLLSCSRPGSPGSPFSRRLRRGSRPRRFSRSPAKSSPGSSWDSTSSSPRWPRGRPAAGESGEFQE